MGSFVNGEVVIGCNSLPVDYVGCLLLIAVQIEGVCLAWEFFYALLIYFYLVLNKGLSHLAM